MPHPNTPEYASHEAALLNYGILPEQLEYFKTGITTMQSIHAQLQATLTPPTEVDLQNAIDSWTESVRGDEVAKAHIRQLFMDLRTAYSKYVESHELLAYRERLSSMLEPVLANLSEEQFSHIVNKIATMGACMTVPAKAMKIYEQLTNILKTVPDVVSHFESIMLFLDRYIAHIALPANDDNQGRPMISHLGRLTAWKDIDLLMFDFMYGPLAFHCADPNTLPHENRRQWFAMKALVATIQNRNIVLLSQIIHSPAFHNMPFYAPLVEQVDIIAGSVN